MTKQYTPEELAQFLDDIAEGAKLDKDDLPSMARGGAYEEEYDNTIAASTQAAYMLRQMQWKPIETAPKDGTLILVGSVHSNNVDQCDWHYDEVCLADHGHWRATGGKAKVGNFLNYEPTHWMPLPSSPDGGEYE